MLGKMGCVVVQSVVAIIRKGISKVTAATHGRGEGERSGNDEEIG